ncbi:hypothetical protein L484_016227 [Morus notabilis]|uniref:Uncharacterized protein n=1 Tax=Morus notabilis TaxID=981085 RepID=W9REM5_9ROSA|nr:hypothetical protein L484_016227 [Morus notabilis]
MAGCLTPFLQKRIRSSLISFLRNDGTLREETLPLPRTPSPSPLLVFIRFVLHIREALHSLVCTFYSPIKFQGAHPEFESEGVGQNNDSVAEKDHVPDVEGVGGNEKEGKFDVYDTDELLTASEEGEEDELRRKIEYNPNVDIHNPEFRVDLVFPTGESLELAIKEYAN